MRSYNGQCYALGSSISKRYQKVHPGDTVRMVLDHDEHTISYSVNGSKLEVVFFDVPVKEFFPAIATYGSNDKIVRLLKVETSAPQQQAQFLKLDEGCACWLKPGEADGPHSTLGEPLKLIQYDSAGSVKVAKPNGDDAWWMHSSKLQRQNPTAQGAFLCAK